MANIPRAAKLKIAHCSNDHNLLNTPFSIMHLQRMAHVIKSEWPLKTQSNWNTFKQDWDTGWHMLKIIHFCHILDKLTENQKSG